MLYPTYFNVQRQKNTRYESRMHKVQQYRPDPKKFYFDIFIRTETDQVSYFG